MIKIKKENILVMTPSGCEISLGHLCNKEYLKINNLMHMIEREFKISLHDYPDLRKEILNISNFIKRIPYLKTDIL